MLDTLSDMKNTLSDTPKRSSSANPEVPQNTSQSEMEIMNANSFKNNNCESVKHPIVIKTTKG